MRAAITAAPGGEVSVEQVDAPRRRAGSVLVDIHVALVTLADWRTYSTGSEMLFPLVQGTGGAGTLASGGGSLIVGSRVMVWPRVACGRCSWCGAARREMCTEVTMVGRERGGTLAEQVLVPRDNVVNVPNGLGLAEAAAAIEYADPWRLLREAGLPQDDRRVAIVGPTTAARATYRMAQHLAGDVSFFESSGDSAGEGLYDSIVAVGTPVGSLIDQLAIEGRLVLRDPVDSAASRIDGTALAKRHQRVVSAGPAGRQDVVEVLRWITDGEFSPSLSDTGRLGEVHKVLERVGESAQAIAIPFD